ncbi:MAG TPA: hypothetical protein DG757_24590 [Bacillus sp. (in: Bacteria)]|nr:hypothetical protein [Bacillus sp. (in: firmicutes)]
MLCRVSILSKSVVTNLYTKIKLGSVLNRFLSLRVDFFPVNQCKISFSRNGSFSSSFLRFKLLPNWYLKGQLLTNSAGNNAT